MLIGNRYEVRSELGRGGFGTTYAAVDRRDGREVAVKVLDLARVADWKAVELFEREARVLQSLDHPGIPAYVEFRPLESEKQAYLVQTLAPGQNLEALLRTRRFSEGDLVDLTGRLLEILDYLTTLHPVVIHRDIKPANILLAEDGTVSLVDFGAVRDMVEVGVGGGVTVAGTFGYMAPEQLQGEASPSSDLYGLGMTLIHLATGRVPSELPQRRLKPDFRPHVHFSDRFEEFIDRLIEPVPDDRFQTAAAALAALRDLAGPKPALSADHIARLRADRERAAAARVARRPPAAAAPRRKGHSRVSVVDDAEGVTVSIRPSRFWRDRELHLSMLVVFGPLVSAMIGAPIAGGTGVVVGLVLTVMLGALAWLTAPTWRLRITHRGDFLLYARSPRRPKWVGTTKQLTVETTPTAKGDRIAYLRFRGGPEPVMMHFYPLGPGDAAALARFGRSI